jgi:hypothetical protein
MQNGHSPAEVQRIRREFEKIKAKRAAQPLASAPPPRRSVPSAPTKQLEARFTVTQGLLILFLTLVLYVIF